MVMDFSKLSNEELYEYALAIVNVTDWWKVTGTARQKPAQFTPFWDEWQRTKAEVYRRGMQDQLQLG